MSENAEARAYANTDEDDLDVRNAEAQRVYANTVEYDLTCKDIAGARRRSVNTVDYELHAENAGGKVYVNMGNESGIVNYVRALKFVCMVDDEIHVKSVKDLKFVFTVEYENDAKNATVHKFANIINNEIHCKDMRPTWDTYRLYVENDENKVLKSKKNSHTLDDLGMTFGEWVQYLNTTFENRYGRSIQDDDDVHIDEIIPCSAWELPDENKYCWHYLNSQFLLAEDNLSKGCSV